MKTSPNHITGPLEDEFTNYYSVPIGSVAKYKFYIEKKDLYLLDLDAKDGRKLRFRFDTPFSHTRFNDAVSKLCEINKHRNLFVHDYSKKIKERGDNEDALLSDLKLGDLVMNDYTRQGVFLEGRALFKPILMEDKIRLDRRIDLPSHVIVPFSLADGDHLRCAYSRVNGRFPTLTYFNKRYGFALWRSS